MHPSLTITFISLMPASLLTAGLSAWIWRTTDRSRFIASWALASGFMALTSLLFGLRGTLPEFLVILVANAALHLSQMLFWAGARWLRGAHVPLWVLPLPSLSWLLACTQPGFVESPGVRLMMASALLMGEALAFAIEMWRGGLTGRVRTLARMMMGLALLHLVIQTIQLVGVAMAGPVTLLTFLAIVVAGPIVLAIGFLGLALAIARAADRDATLLAEGRLRESELQTRAAEREAAALRAGRAEVERLHTSLPALIFVRELNADGISRLLYRGGDSEAVTGWPEDRLNKIDNIATLADEPDPVLKALAAAACFGTGSIDWRIRRPDSSTSWLRTTWTMQEKRPDGSGILVGYCINISAEREANARAEAAGRLASLGEMATGLAHELMQPLQVIMTGSEIAQAAARRINATAIDARLETVIGQVVRAGAIINNLRRFGRGDGEGAPIQMIPIETAIENVMVLIGGLLREAGIEVATHLAEDAQAVMGHPVALEQVLTNLLINARDALAACPEGATQRVTLSTEAVDGLVRLRVSDTGGGIAPNIAARVFEPFVTTKGPEKGTGLGLSIAHGLVTGMGGIIEFTNWTEGAVFTITLPMSADGLGDAT